MKKLNVEEAEGLPAALSSRRALLKNNGGDFDNLYKIHRFDQKYHRSRGAETQTKKDFRGNGRKNYKPWQYQKKAQIDPECSSSE